MRPTATGGARLSVWARAAQGRQLAGSLLRSLVAGLLRVSLRVHQRQVRQKQAAKRRRPAGPVRSRHHQALPASSAQPPAGGSASLIATRRPAAPGGQRGAGARACASTLAMQKPSSGLTMYCAR